MSDDNAGFWIDGEWIDEEKYNKLKQARSEGWGQARMEIEYYLKNEKRSAALFQQIAYIRYIADAIAAMEYKEGENVKRI